MKILYTLLEHELGSQYWLSKDLQRAVKTLHSDFTEKRDTLPKNYMNNKASHEAYLAYYLPLNFEKIVFLLERQKRNLASLFENKSTLRVLDYGCGPGTATQAFLDYLSSSAPPFGTLELTLIDEQTKSLQTAKRLLTDFLEQKKLPFKVRPIFESKLRKDKTFDLVFASNVLNELPATNQDDKKFSIETLWEQTQGALLILEPGHRVSSQRLIRVRERLLNLSLKNNETARILAPCTHEEKCPLFRSKHWCHFSERVHPKSHLLKLNLAFFNNPRSWLKFSYLFISKNLDTQRNSSYFRAIGDLHQSGPNFLSIDLCKPNEKYAHKISRKAPREVLNRLERGKLVQLVTK